MQKKREKYQIRTSETSNKKKKDDKNKRYCKLVRIASIQSEKQPKPHDKCLIWQNKSLVSRVFSIGFQGFNELFV